jgi:cytochrome c2
VIGVVVKDTNGDGKLDVMSGDKVGVSCAICHAITDGSVVKPEAQGHTGGGRGSCSFQPDYCFCEAATDKSVEHGSRS